MELSGGPHLAGRASFEKRKKGKEKGKKEEQWSCLLISRHGNNDEGSVVFRRASSRGTREVLPDFERDAFFAHLAAPCGGDRLGFDFLALRVNRLTYHENERSQRLEWTSRQISWIRTRYKILFGIFFVGAAENGPFDVVPSQSRLLLNIASFVVAFVFAKSASTFSV